MVERIKCKIKMTEFKGRIIVFFLFALLTILPIVSLNVKMVATSPGGSCRSVFSCTQCTQWERCHTTCWTECDYTTGFCLPVLRCM